MFTAEEDEIFRRSNASQLVRKRLVAGKCTSAYVQEAVRLSSIKCCPTKKQHTEKTIEGALRNSRDKSHAYRCPSCSFLHVGRPVVWATLAEKKIEENQPPVVKLIKSIKRRFK